MNKCHFVGKLTDDPVLYDQDRTNLVRFTLAIEEYRKDKSGKKIRRVEFLEFAKKMMNKGTTIFGGCCETKPLHINKISVLKN